MISVFVFGDKLYKENSEKILNSTCSHCKMQNTLEAICYQSYFHIFFIPVFPNKKQYVSQCLHCGTTQKIEEQGNPALINLNKKSSNPIWMWVGLPIFIILLSWIIFTKWINPSAESIAKDCLTHIQPAQVFEVQINDNYKQLLLVKSTAADGTIKYQLGKSQINLNQRFDVSPETITQEFTQSKAIETTQEAFSTLPIINCH